MLDPVDAYDRIAPFFPRLAAERKAYLDAVDQLVVSAIPSGSRSLLDVGAGDGSRGSRIALASGLPALTLLEPSAAMRRNSPAGAQIWAMRAEDLGRMQGNFDAITCLWNVLGHVFPAVARAEVLRQFGRLASPTGIVFVDVNHRYNARHYGTLPTAGRYLRDRIWPSPANGDVTVQWPVEGGYCTTTGHVFTHNEFKYLCIAAGLKIERRFVIDYASGQLRRWSFEGNLLYLLRPESPP